MQRDVVDTARTYIGVIWKHMGRTRNGIDCVGLVLAVGEEHGLHRYPDEYAYSRQSTGAHIIRIFREFSTEIRPVDMAPADVLIMKDTVFPQHVGIISDRPDGLGLIHASAHRRKVVEETIQNDVRQKIITCFRFNELAGK